ncbi:PREDICTED: putative invertase inhibitor [Camelina sativa]|uniref:Invertase inhibitor n=1 Tax=Camelina sativa TaxID=90675 RepID=A0ABM0W4H5_CAMSA|nr:PREDICTED: putative invertase inhibitor [Camelina sativa]
MKFLVSLVMFSLLLNGFAFSQTLIQDSCKKATVKEPALIYNLCVDSLTQDPQSRTATTLEGLIIASTKNAEAKAMNVKGIIEHILKGKGYASIEAELRDCVGFYDDANDLLNTALASVQSHDYKTANGDFSIALDVPENCEDGIKERNKQNSPVSNENNILFQKILIPLAFNNMLI